MDNEEDISSLKVQISEDLSSFEKMVLEPLRCTDLINEFSEWISDHQKFTIYSLEASLYKTGSSIVHLLSLDCLDDAGALARNLIEGTLKFSYLLRPPQDEKLWEYSHVLYSSQLLTDYEDARNIVEMLKRNGVDYSAMLRVFPDEAIKEARSVDPQHRKDANRKWRIIRLMKEFSNDSAHLLILQQYALSSHEVHKSYNSLLHHNDSLLIGGERSVHEYRTYLRNILNTVLLFSIVRRGIMCAFLKIRNPYPTEEAKALINQLGLLKFSPPV